VEPASAGRKTLPARGELAFGKVLKGLFRRKKRK